MHNLNSVLPNVLPATDSNASTDDDFDVTFWQVVEDRPTEYGSKLIGAPLSPKYPTLDESREALVEIKAKHPKAYVARWTIFFNEDDPADVAERNKLLVEIRCGEVNHV